MFDRIRTIRKRWLIATTAAALLAVGLTAGAVFAAGSPARYFGDGISPAAKIHPSSGFHHAGHSQLFPRVAEILGIEEEALSNAFTTAWNELADEQFQARMDALVEDETLTHEQADGAVAWFQSRPADAGPLAFIAVATADADKVGKYLDRMVENELLTQAQADAIADWHAERPDYLPEHRRHMFGGKGRHGRGHDGDGHDGDGNDGDRNDGDRNDGDRNDGDRNDGDRNDGDQGSQSAAPLTPAGTSLGRSG